MHGVMLSFSHATAWFGFPVEHFSTSCSLYRFQCPEVGSVCLGIMMLGDRIFFT
jgi:hypothetical protein